MATCNHCWYEAKVKAAQKKISLYEDLPNVAGPWRQVEAEMKAMLYAYPVCECTKVSA